MISNPAPTTKHQSFPFCNTGTLINQGANGRQLGRCSDNGHYIILNFQVPWDFAAITKAILLCYQTTSVANVDIDIESTYAAEGEAKDNHSESDAVTTYDFTAGQLMEIDLSGILSNLAPGDNVGISFILTTDPGGETYIVDLEFRYA